MAPSLYHQVIQRLQQAKAGENDVRRTKGAIAFLASTLEKAIREQALNQKALGEFIADERLLFATDREVSRAGQADYRLVTNGLLDQALDAVGVVGHQIHSLKLRQAIYDLDAALAGKQNDADATRGLLEILAFLQLAAVE